MQSKIILFLILILFFPGIISCEEAHSNNHIIPYVSIETEIPLWMPDFQCLTMPSQPVYITESYPKSKPLGYNGNGIVVINTGSGEYKCWDATCTKDPDTGIPLEIKGAIASCPECSTEFSLLLGIPLKSNSTENSDKIYPLKEYPVRKTSNNTLNVRY